jgi:hypothetical protein
MHDTEFAASRRSGLIGSPRIDSSAHVWFANAQFPDRFIEEIDFDYAAAS